MKREDFTHLPELTFIEGIANGTYTPNDAVTYCRGCFDKEGFLSLLFACTYGLDFPLERQRKALTRAKDLVYHSLMKQGVKLSLDYELGLPFDVDVTEWVGTDTEREIQCRARNSEPILPSVLNTPLARTYLSRAKRYGFIDNGYKPIVTAKNPNYYFAIFAAVMSRKLHLNKAISANGLERIAWKHFETIWGIDAVNLKMWFANWLRIYEYDDWGEIDVLKKIFQ